MSQFNPLQQAIKDLDGCRTKNEKIEALNKAFKLFSQETSRLECAYLSLKNQFQAVYNELEHTNQTLEKKVLQLDTITRYLNGILTNISQGILFVDLSGTITTCNETAEKTLGISSMDVLLSRFWDTFKDDFFGFSMKKALAEREAPLVNYVHMITSQKQERELEVHTKFVLYSVDKKMSPLDTLECIQGIIILFRDLSEFRYLQTLANRHDRLKELGEMAAMLAHEIRNPLGGIKGFASLLARDLKDTPHLSQMAHSIVEGADCLDNLVKNVLSYARPFKVHFKLCDIVDLLKNIIDELQTTEILQANIHIKIHSKFKKFHIPADPQLLKTALLNLILNAVQAMPKGGMINIDIEKNPDIGIIKIQDTGQGISKENLDKLFSPIFTTKPDGNGLGLCEVHKVIESHGGHLHVSSYEDLGTTFTIELPLRAFAGK